MATTTQARGLGKGLSALISENYLQPSSKPVMPSSNTEEVTGNGIDTLAPHHLHEGKYQPRSHFNEAALSELADSIRKNGIMQPIIVRPSTQIGKYEIIAGERRWRAAKLANLSIVPVIIREISDKQALELALVENIQRQDLSPLEEALGYQRLIEDFDYTQEELAGTVGKSRSHIANLLRLLALPDEVKTLLEKGEISMGHARALLSVSNPIELAHEIVRRGLSVRQVEQASREANGSAPKQNLPRPPGSHYRAGPAPKDPDIIALEESLSESLGMRVGMHCRGQSGEIIISYDSLSQLDTILQRLGGDSI